MGGINSLSGLNKVSVDFQPTITTNVQNTGNALRVTEKRLDEAIEYAKKLKQDGKVYNAGQWKVYRNQNWMTPIESELRIRKSDNKTVVTVGRDLKCVNDFLIQNCPSYFKRDYVHLMFKKPKAAA